MINEYIINQLCKKIPAKRRNEYFLKIKRKASKKFGLPNPTNVEILKTYRKMVKSKKIKPNKDIENLLITKNIRTLSGVAVVAVLTKPYACPGTCVYCPTEKDMPKSYLSNEPAVMRAILTDFHPYKQVAARLKSLEATGINKIPPTPFYKGGVVFPLYQRGLGGFPGKIIPCNNFKKPTKNPNTELSGSLLKRARIILMKKKLSE